MGKIFSGSRNPMMPPSRPRARPAVQTEEAKESSARCLQRAWRKRFWFTTTKKHLKRFVKAGPTKERISAMSYDDMRAYFKDMAYLKVTKNILFRLIHICNDLHGDDTDFIAEADGKVRQARPVLTLLQSTPIAKSAIEHPGFVPYALAVNKRKRDQGDTARAMANKIELPPMVKPLPYNPSAFFPTNQAPQHSRMSHALFMQLSSQARQAVSGSKESSGLSMLAELALRTAGPEGSSVSSRAAGAAGTAGAAGPSGAARTSQAAAWAPIIQVLSSSVGSGASKAPILQAQAGPARAQVQPVRPAQPAPQAKPAPQAQPAQQAPQAPQAKPGPARPRWVLARKSDGKPPFVTTSNFANAYLIVYQREQTCNFMGKADERIYKSAKEMLEIFDILISALKDGKDLKTLGADVTGEFMPKVFQYMADFEDWYPMRKRKCELNIKSALERFYIEDLDLRDHPVEYPAQVELREMLDVYMPRLEMNLSDLIGAAPAVMYIKKVKAELAKGVPEKASIFSVMPRQLDTCYISHQVVSEIEPPFRFSEELEIGEEYKDIIDMEEKRMIENRLWSDLEAELKCEPPRYERCNNILSYLRDKLVLIFDKQERMIRDAIDIPHIMQQLRAGAFDWQSSVRLLASIMLIMRANQLPSRHACLDEGWRQQYDVLTTEPVQDRLHAFCESLRFLFGHLDKIKIDCNNNMVDVKRVQIRAEGFQFNMQAVSESYMTGTLSFMRTEAWLARHVMYGNRPLLAQGNPAVYQALHLNATLDLVLERRRIAHDTVPELYRHDVHRLFKYQTEFYYITVTMGIISIAGPACQFDEDKMETVARYLLHKDRRFMTPDDDMAFVADVCKNQDLLESLKPCFKRSSKIFVTCSERLRDNTRAYYRDETFPDQQNPPRGVVHFTERCHRAVRGFIHMTKVNREMYSSIYNVLIPWVVRAYPPV